MNSVPAIRVEHLRKSFNGCIILNGIDLSVDQGETVVVIGGSGSGKSTLLRCLSFLDLPDTVDYWCDGKALAMAKQKGAGMRPRTAQDRDFLGRRIGMIFQDFGLWPHMNVLKNVMLPQTVALKRTKNEAHKRAMAALERVGLASYCDRLPQSLSGGQKQRVAIARTLVLDKQTILLDEPTSALDPTMTAEVEKLIADLGRSSTSLILVTHNMRLARSVADRIIFLHQGKVAEAGTVADVFERPKTAALIDFLGTHARAAKATAHA